MATAVLVSACLLGERVRYNGRDARAASDILDRWCGEERVVPFCPEVAGGLGVPRPAAEIQHGDGADVLDGRARVLTIDGGDVTMPFERGARAALDHARAHRVRVAVLKEGSPSCGTGQIGDGSFSGARRDGPGVTAALLERHGIHVFNEGQLAEAAACVAALDRL